MESVIHGKGQSLPFFSLYFCDWVSIQSCSPLSCCLNLDLAQLPFSCSIFNNPQHSGFTPFLSFFITSIYFYPLTFFPLFLLLKLLLSTSSSVWPKALALFSFHPSPNWKKFIKAGFLPISSSSEVMDLDRIAMAGVLSLLLCWGTRDGWGRKCEANVS